MKSIFALVSGLGARVLCAAAISAAVWSDDSPQSDSAASDSFSRGQEERSLESAGADAPFREAIETVRVELAQAQAQLEESRQALAIAEKQLEFHIKSLEEELRLVKLDRKTLDAELALRVRESKRKIELIGFRLEFARIEFERAQKQKESGRAGADPLRARLLVSEAEAELKQAEDEHDFLSNHEVPRRIAGADLETRRAERAVELARLESKARKKAAQAGVHAAEAQLEFQKRLLESLKRDAALSLASQRARLGVLVPQAASGGPSQTVVCVAPTDSFRPADGPDLLRKINSILPFEVTPDRFLSKSRSGGLTGWIIVDGEQRKRLVKEKLASSDALQVIQVEALTPGFERVFRLHQRAADAVADPNSQ